MEAGVVVFVCSAVDPVAVRVGVSEPFGAPDAACYVATRSRALPRDLSTFSAHLGEPPSAWHLCLIPVVGDLASCTSVHRAVESKPLGGASESASCASARLCFLPSAL
jgi:hypothetical protein